MVTRETFHHEYFDSVLIFLLNTVVIHFVKKCHSQEATLDVNPVHSSFYEGADEYRQNFNSSTQEILLNTSVHSEISTSSGISIQTVQSHFRNSENETESIAPSFISEQESAAIGSEHRATPYIPTPVDKFQHLNVLVSSIPNTVVIPDVLMSQTATTQTAMSTTLQTEIHELKSSDNFKTVPWLIHDSLSRIDVITSPVTKLQKSSQPTKMTDLSTQTNVTPSILSSEEAIRDETDSQVFNSFQPDTTFVISSHHSTTVSSQLTSITLKVTNGECFIQC